MNEDGHTSNIRDKILTINVKPGWRAGTKITFPKEGDQGPNNIPGKILIFLYSFPAGYKVTVHEYYQFLHEMISNDTRCSSVIRWPNWVQCFSSVLSELSSLITRNRIFPQNKATECDVIILFNNTTLFPWLIVCYLLLHQLTSCSLWKTSLIQSSSVTMITLSILLLFLLER